MIVFGQIGKCRLEFYDLLGHALCNACENGKECIAWFECNGYECERTRARAVWMIVIVVRWEIWPSARIVERSS